MFARRVPGLRIPGLATVRCQNVAVGDVAAGRTHNPFIRSARGGRVLGARPLPVFLAHTPRGVGILTTTGRRTGKSRRKCLRAVRHGDKVYPGR